MASTGDQEGAFEQNPSGTATGLRPGPRSQHRNRRTHLRRRSRRRRRGPFLRQFTPAAIRSPRRNGPPSAWTWSTDGSAGRPAPTSIPRIRPSSFTMDPHQEALGARGALRLSVGSSTLPRKPWTYRNEDRMFQCPAAGTPSSSPGPQWDEPCPRCGLAIPRPEASPPPPARAPVDSRADVAFLGPGPGVRILRAVFPDGGASVTPSRAKRSGSPRRTPAPGRSSNAPAPAVGRADELDGPLGGRASRSSCKEAGGAHFTDVDGHRYLDLCLGDTGAMTGHAPAAAVEAIVEQARRGITFMLPTEDAIWVGEELARRFGLPYWQTTLTATDANRFAIRLARHITERPRILVFNWCYHGTVDETFVTLRDGTPGAASRQPRASGRSGRDDARRRVQRHPRARGRARARRRGLRAGRARDDQHRHRASGEPATTTRCVRSRAVPERS